MIFSLLCDIINQIIILNREKVMAKIQESGEMYLETIYVLSKKGPVRSTDVAERMGYSKPSISIAIKNLRINGYATVDEKGYIELTETGREIAERVYERHTLLTKWLSALGVDEITAAKDACRIEHIISDSSFEAIKKHIEGK